MDMNPEDLRIFDIYSTMQFFNIQQWQSGLLVMIPGFHPRDPGSIPLVGGFYLNFFLIAINGSRICNQKNQEKWGLQKVDIAVLQNVDIAIHAL